MALLLAALALLGAGALAAVLLMARDRWALGVGTAAGSAGCLLGATASALELAQGSGSSLQLGWTLPVGSVHLGIDPLSAVFLLCVFGLGGVALVYGAGYLPGSGRRLGPPTASLNLLVASMAAVLLARDGVFFLFAWECMALVSFLLVAHEHERPEVRRAGIVYLVASHAGTACLFAFFVLLARESGSFDLQAPAAGAAGSAWFFLLALLGFGTKAALWPLHIWLPQAHPAAPSHVSALMSGVMIKCGLYGLLRTLLLLGPAPAWWGWTLAGAGAATAVLGVVHALAQDDLKRSLAYSSVENVGIIVLAVGLGVVGLAENVPALAAAGFGAALLHTVNHALFKGLLFMAAGSVLHGAGTRNLEALGGLARRMPATTVLFALGAGAASALPGLNGFASEWLAYQAIFTALFTLGLAGKVGAAAALAALALTGGLAAACFARAFGVAFCGAPRGSGAAGAHESGRTMLVPMAVLAAGCVVVGAWPEGALRLCGRALVQMGAGGAAPVAQLGMVARLGTAALLLGALLFGIRALLLRRRPVAAGPTWGCGYAAPAVSMQYSAGSFSGPLAWVLRPLLSARPEGRRPEGLFPASATHAVFFDDAAEERLWRRLLAYWAERLERLRRFHHPRVHQYLLYVFFALVAMLTYVITALRR